MTAVVAVAVVMRVDAGAVAAVVGMGVDADDVVMRIDDDAVAAVLGMGVELDDRVGCSAPGWTAAHNGQNQTH